MDDFKRPSEKGKVTMEDWLEVGGSAPMLFRIQEAVRIWKEEHGVKQKLLQDVMLQSMNDVHFDLEDYDESEL